MGSAHLPLFALALTGCAAAGLPQPGILPPVAARIEDRVWLDTSPDAAEGAFRAFLSDGTLVEGSCAGPYRLAAWRRIDGATLAWDGPGGVTRAEIAAAGPRDLALLVDPEGAAVPLAFRRAEAPMACP